MAINNKHPLYGEFIHDWYTMRDTYRGERVIKSKGQTYLPTTSGMRADGMQPNQQGWEAYQSYLQRAVFHDYVSDAVEAMIGVMHNKPPSIQLPTALEPLRSQATNQGEGLVELLRRINEQQLVTGRLGLLLDLPDIPNPSNPLPYIALYNAETIINWDNSSTNGINSTNLITLDESDYIRKQDFSWEYIEKYRVLTLGALDPNDSLLVYRTGLFNKTNLFSENSLFEPSIRGATLGQIPFVFINSKDLVSTPDDPPLIGLAKLALAIYRGEADYRQNLFMQGQDTLVVMGSGDQDFRIGAGATILLPSGGEAKYIGVSSNGLPEQRQCLENDKVLAAHKAGQLVDSRSKESGDALQIRVAAQTATLNQIALSGAAGLQQLLRIAATWVGANAEEVVVTPNLDFEDDVLTGKNLVDLMTAKTMGAPLSNKSIHRLMQEKNLTIMVYEDELSEIQDEPPLMEGGSNDDLNV